MRAIEAVRPVIGRYEDYVKEIASIWETGAMTNNGPKVQKLRWMLLEYMGVENVELFVNGHSALFIALKALGLNGEVITSPFTFASTTNAIVQAGLTPVFGDVDESYNLDPKSAEKLITDKTCAIVTPHIFGIPVDVHGLASVAEKHNLKIIYDAAQAFGTKVDGKDIGAFGDMTMFSLHAIKVFNAVEGGILAYRDAKLKKTLEMYRNFGIDYGSGGDVSLCGFNAKMDEFRAAMGIVNLPCLDVEIAKRKKLAGRYIENIESINGLETYKYKENIDYNYAYFPLKVTEEYALSRDELYGALAARGVGTRKLYDKLTSDFSSYRGKYKKDAPNADMLSKIALDLPLYGSLTTDDIDYICENLAALGK